VLFNWEIVLFSSTKDKLTVFELSSGETCLLEKYSSNLKKKYIIYKLKIF